MTLRTVKLRLPEELLEHLGTSALDIEKNVAEALVLKLVSEGTISASYSADVLGCSYHELLSLLHAHSIPLIQYDPNEVDEGIDALAKYPK